MCRFCRIAALIVLLLSGSAAWAQEQVLRVGYFELAPHVVVAPDGQEASGPAVEHLRNIARRMGVQLRIEREALPLDRLLLMLQNGEIDMALALGRSPEREKFLRYPARPFFLMQPSLMVLKESRLQEIRSVEDLQGVRIGVYSAGFMSVSMRTPGLRLEKLYGHDVVGRNLQKMQKARIDAVYSPDAWDLRAAAIGLGQPDSFRLLSLPEPPRGLYAAFAQKVDAALVRRYERALAAGEPYLKVLARHLGGK